MSIDAELANFYRRHGFGDLPGARPKTVPVYTGCLLVPLPNIETRNRYLKYHDLHHLVTGYSVGRIGEGQISAWELGTGSMRESLLLGTMNLIALSTGWVLDRNKMWAAFCRGRQSRNLYSMTARQRIEAGEFETISDLRSEILDSSPERPVIWSDHFTYGCYVTLSIAIHASIAIPAMIARTFSDLANGKTLRETFRPERRSDLF